MGAGEPSFPSRQHGSSGRQSLCPRVTCSVPGHLREAEHSSSCLALSPGPQILFHTKGEQHQPLCRLGQWGRRKSRKSHLPLAVTQLLRLGRRSSPGISSEQLPILSNSKTRASADGTEVRSSAILQHSCEPVPVIKHPETQIWAFSLNMREKSLGEGRDLRGRVSPAPGALRTTHRHLCLPRWPHSQQQKVERSQRSFHEETELFFIF